MKNKLAILTIALLSGCSANVAPPVTENHSPLHHAFVSKDGNINKDGSVYLTASLNTVNSSNFSSKDNLKTSNAETGAGNPTSYKLKGRRYKVLPFSKNFKQSGIASWYGKDFNGKKTSNGEIYNMHDMTAAHKTLPIPSYVKVTNLKNNRSVVVRINDRGPYHGSRVIDLSYAAAKKLNMHNHGTEKVKIEAINARNHNTVYVQLGVFSNQNNALKLQKKISSKSLPTPEIRQIVYNNGKKAYKVQIGPLYSHSQVKKINLKLAKLGISKTLYVTTIK